MVDDSEFVRRRHLARGRPRKFEIPAAAAAAAAAAVQHHQLQFSLNRQPSPSHPPPPSSAASGDNVDEAATEEQPLSLIDEDKNVSSDPPCFQRSIFSAQ